MKTVLDRQLGSAPSQPPRGPFDVGIGTFDHSYRRRLEAWEADLSEDIRQIHCGLTKLHAQHRIRVTIENIGPISAEGLSLEVRSGNMVLYSMPYEILINGPTAPRPRLIPYHLPTISPRSLLLPRREPFSFYWEESGPDNQIVQSCASFRQGKKYNLDISVELLSRTSPKAQIEAIVTASNMKGEARSQLLVEVRSATVQFDDVYDMRNGTIKMLPAYDIPDDSDLDDYMLFRNSGAEYEPD